MATKIRPIPGIHYEAGHREAETLVGSAYLARRAYERRHRSLVREVWGARLVAALTIAALAGVLYVAAEGSVRAATDLLLKYHLLG